MLHLSSSYILVNDMDRSSEFYSNLFGVKPTIITPDRWVQFDFGGNVLAICNQLFDLKTIAGGGDIDSMYSKEYIRRLSKHRTIFGNNVVHKFHTDDLSKEHARITKIHGGTVSDILYMNIESPYSFFTVADPDGNIIEVFGEYAVPEKQVIEEKDEKMNIKAPVIEKPVTAAPVPPKPEPVEVISPKPAPVEIAPEKEPVSKAAPEKPAAAEPAPVEIAPEKEPVSKAVPEKPAAAEPAPAQPAKEKTEENETPTPPVEKSFKDKSILKAAIEKEKEKASKAAVIASEENNNGKKADEQDDDLPVLITPNWEEIADRLKKTVIEKTSRPNTSVKEKEEIPPKQAEAEPEKKVVERPALRPIIVKEKPMVSDDSEDDEPSVMTPIWEESYPKTKKPAAEKNHSPAHSAKEAEPKADKTTDDTPRRKSSAAEEKEVEPEPKKAVEIPDLPPIVIKNIRNVIPVKEPEIKPEKQPSEKPIFKPIEKEKERVSEKEPEKEPEKQPQKAAKPSDEAEKPKPLSPPIWEKPSEDLWGDQRK